MKIQFGIKQTSWVSFGTFIFGCVTVVIAFFNLNHQHSLGESQQRIANSRGLNVTHTSPFFCCEIPYKDCLCSVISKRSNTSEMCITNVQLASSHILSSISFWLQFYLVRTLCSLHTVHRRVIIYALWITSIFPFIIMTISIYWSSCFQIYTAFILYLTGGTVLMLTFHNYIINHDDDFPISNSNITIAVQPSETTNVAKKSWQELL